MHKLTTLEFSSDGSFTEKKENLRMADAICKLQHAAITKEKILSATVEKPYVVKINEFTYGWVDNEKEGYDEAAKVKALKKFEKRGSL